MLEVFGIGCLVVVLFFFAKEFGKKLPLGCLIVGVIFLFIVININILEISSSQTAVVLFVDWEDGEKAHKLLNEVLE